MASNFVKGAIVGMTILVAMYMFQQSIGIALEIARNYRQILSGEYIVSPISSTAYYGFMGYAIMMTLGFSLVPAGEK